MSIANTNVVAKVAAVAAGLGLVFSSFAFAVPAKAATVEELEAQVAALLAQLQSAQGTTTTGAAFTADMTLGASGAEVTRLQNWLISKGYSIPAGATGYFGAQTAAALAAYQSAKGITPAAGYFGPMTRAAVNAELGTGGSTGGSTGGNTGGLEGGAGNLDDADFITSLNNEDAGEGDETEVAGLELEADDNSDLEITAVKLSFFGTSTSNSEDLDDYAESIVVYFDGEEVASEDVDDMDEDDGEWSTTISLEDSVIEAGATGELVVAVVAHDNIDSSDLGDNDWGVTFENIRYMDAQGAVVTDSSTGDIGAERSFEFATFTTANDVELTIDESDETPEEGTLEVDEDGGEEVTLLIGEFEAEGSDITVTSVSASVTPTGTGDASQIASEYVLYVDGDAVQTIDSDECTITGDCDGTGAAGSSVRYDFDDVEFEVGEGETVEFEVRAVLNEISATFVAGDTLTVEVDSDLIEAEDASDDLAGSALTGVANGETITFRDAGLSAEVVSEDATAADGTGTFTFVFDLTAFGDDEITLAASDFTYAVTGGISGSTTASTSSAILTADDCAEKSGSNYTIDGETCEFTLDVYVTIDNADAVGAYVVTVTDIDGTTVDASDSAYIPADN